jgi:MoaA/NifB/PqqE/SkfB family radical SAM enzyme
MPDKSQVKRNEPYKKENTFMTSFKIQLETLLSIGRTPQILKVKPATIKFLLDYMSKFTIHKVGPNLIIHSHLPPINSPAYKRFVTEHLIDKIDGPSHAQIGLTNKCPQNCIYCYNKKRTGQVMDTATIIKTIQDLKQMGVFWLGFTGGEPLLNKDIVEITRSCAQDCTLKLFTTGCTLTPELAADLRDAGLSYVSISLDHWDEQEHDRARRFKGAFQTALKAIEIFKNLGDVHVGVSAVLSKQMLGTEQVEQFLHFLISLGVSEAWLSETKPSVEAFWRDDLIISEAERLNLIKIQDQYNKEGKITVNYLSHFESREHFGCNAGHKMVYVVAFGEVSPCVFTPMSFGNVMEQSIDKIFAEMKNCFPSEDSCFINKNYRLLQKYGQEEIPLNKQKSLQMMKEI